MSAFEGFVAVHQYQLKGIPEELWQPLFMKLAEDYLDAGNFFELHYGDPTEGYSLHAKADTTIKKHSDIFIIDHAWTTTPETARKELETNPTLLDRLENLMDIEKEELEESDDEEAEEQDGSQADEEVVKLVAEQANVSLQKAREALAAENHEIVNAIARLTLSEDFKKESDRLQDQVLGKIMETGTPQEKAAREKAERRAKREAEWLKNRVNAVYEKMWSFINTYSYSILKQNGEPETRTAWYVSDEVGSALSHSNDPNVACIPFIFSRGAQGMIPYSVFYPVKDIAPGAVVSCDLVPKNLVRPVDQTAYLLAFKDRVLPYLELVNDVKQDELVQISKTYNSTLQPQSFTPSNTQITNAEHSLEQVKQWAAVKSDSTVSIFTPSSDVRQHIKLPNIKFTDAVEKADVALFLGEERLETNAELSNTVKSNRLENATCLTSRKDLAELIHKTYGQPAWASTTYNLVTQLAEFVGDALQNPDDIWIVRPCNASGSRGVMISKTLSQLIRQHDDPEPCVVQRYLSTPCLYNQKRFDLQYTVLVQRLEPTLIACVYNTFGVRLANKPFSLDDLNDTERLVTKPDHQLTQLDDKSFIRNMEKQHNIQWSTIQNEIYAMIKAILAAAATQAQPLGLLPANDEQRTRSGNSFGLFEFSVTLTQTHKPLLNQVNASTSIQYCKNDALYLNKLLSLVDARLGDTEEALKSFTIL